MEEKKKHPSDTTNANPEKTKKRKHDRMKKEAREAVPKWRPQIH